MYNFLCYRYSAMLEGGWGRTVGVGATPRLLAAVVAILSHLLLFLLLSNAPSALGEEGVVAPAPSELLPHLLDGQAAREPKIDSKFSALLFIILFSHHPCHLYPHHNCLHPHYPYIYFTYHHPHYLQYHHYHYLSSLLSW